MTTQHRTTNLNSVYSQGEHQTECPEQVAQPIVPATYEKDADPFVRMKEGVKRLVGKGTRGIGPKHSRAKPNGITGKKHAEETAKDMFGLHEAMHVGLEHDPTYQHREIPIEHRGTDASDPKKLAAINREEQHVTETETGTGIGTETRTDEGSVNQIQDRMADRDLAQPSDQHIQSEAKHVSAPSAGLSEAEGTRLEGRRGMDTIEPRRDDQLASHGSVPAGTGIATETGMTRPGMTGIGEHQRHDGLLGDTKASHLDMEREEILRKDPAEGLTPGVKAAFIEDQRERALLGNKKFEKGRIDRSNEGETGLGQKLLAGIQTVAQTATQGIKTAATKITGYGTETTETGTHINEHGTEARKEETL